MAPDPASAEFSGPLLRPLAAEDYSCDVCPFDYASCSPQHAAELAAQTPDLATRLNVAGFLDEVARTSDWDRLANRLPTEVRTARWLVRQAAHEGMHHLRDIAEVRERLLT